MQCPSYTKNPFSHLISVIFSSDFDESTVVVTFETIFVPLVVALVGMG